MTITRGHRTALQTLSCLLLTLTFVAGHQPLAADDLLRVPFHVKRTVPLQYDAGDFLWFHPRAVVLPATTETDGRRAVMTLQKHLYTSDHYSGLSVMHTADGGATWTAPDPRPELDWVAESPDVDIAVADVTPGWHPQTKKVIAVGCQVRYSKTGAQLDDKPRTQQTAYAVFNPADGSWTRWKVVDMPQEEIFNFARSACAQWVAEEDGAVLLPCYIGINASAPSAVTVVRCTFDGNELTYDSHGTIHRLDENRGLHEPSVVRFGGRYYMTVRHDAGALVTVSDDGLHYEELRPWRFDDGTELGSYNTQQHWFTLKDGLFLAYTRRGDENDHIFRHRAPLLAAQVDPQRLHVLKDTEQVVVAERGATLGNFGACQVSENEAWVTVAEGIWNDDARRHGATGAVFLARVIAEEDVTPPSTPRTAELLRTGSEPVRIVCFGDSVTGVYYHTGSRRAYTDMLGLGIDRVFPRADVTTINAGISGNTTSDGLARIQRDVLDQNPALVTVMFGLNDMTRVPLEDYRTNLETIVDKCRAAGAEVVLCTPNAVFDTPGRAREKLVDYCEVVRSVGRDMDVPVCDWYAAGEDWRETDPRAWRLTMSDAIHPNMDGHQQIAELLTRTITGRTVSLADIGPPVPFLPRTRQRLHAGEPVQVLAMTPTDELFSEAVLQAFPEAELDVTAWSAEEKSLAELMQEAQETVREMQPDLVVLSIPRAALPDDEEQLIHDYAWTMNHSLAFGTGGWDCLVIDPDVLNPLKTPADTDSLVQQLVGAQDLPAIIRDPGEDSSPAEIVQRWVSRHLK
ncbi:MAG: lysophospholipase [Planctomycetota bacterium]|nr:MAG: lysophospholipase [Planctomycetota bacterium]